MLRDFSLELSLPALFSLHCRVRAVHRSGRRLWGSGKGNFRTEGQYGAATVRGTIWLTEDRCNGTFFKVKRGAVTIRDFNGNRTFTSAGATAYSRVIDFARFREIADKVGAV